MLRDIKSSLISMKEVKRKHVRLFWVIYPKLDSISIHRSAKCTNIVSTLSKRLGYLNTRASDMHLSLVASHWLTGEAVLI